MSQVGRYRLLFQLGAGGMAEVFLAHETGQAGIERLVVIKRVLPHLATDDMFLNMLLNEARISTRLNHPNIAHVYEVGEHHGRPYIAMEFVHGVSLRSVLRRRGKGRLSPALAALVASKVAGALHHAHTLTNLKGEPLNIVHRDISPDNIHISHEGVVKVLDFGIAKARTNVENTMSGVLKGKYTYMAPEQTRMEVLDHRADLFCLGIVLHEMLSYKKLFKKEGKDPAQVLAEIAESRVPPPSLVAGIPVPQELDRVALRALQRDRDERYGSAREMQEDLLAALKQHPATEMDLEQFMAKVFGGVELHRQRLREAVEEQSYVPELSPGTPSGSLPTWSGDPGSAGSLVAGESRSQPGPRRRSLLMWASLTLVGAALVAVVLAWHLGKAPPERPAPPPTPAAAVAARPDPRPPKARVPAPRPAQLIVKTKPPGAKVLLDGQPAGEVTPTVLKDLTTGTHELTLRLERHHVVSLSLEIAPGEVKEVYRTLTPLPHRRQPARPRRHHPTGTGTLTLNSTPWAVVHVDGKRVGVTPILRHKLPAGVHRVRLRNPDLNRERSLDITIPANGDVKRSLKLQGSHSIPLNLKSR